MTIFQLECFCALADSLNFTQTANAMFITQPALSRAISSLEQELQLTLLQRTTHSVTLTPAGKIFSSKCHKMLKEFQRGSERARSAQAGQIGSVRIGFQRDNFETYIVDFVNLFRRSHTDITLELLPLSVNELNNALQEKIADAVISSGPPANESIRSLMIANLPECVALPLDHPLAGNDILDMRDLKNEKFIAMARSISCSGFESIIQKSLAAGFEAQIVAQVELLPTLMTLVACGQGISILHRDMLARSNGRIAFVPLRSVSYFRRFLMWDINNDNPCLKPLIALGHKWQDELEFPAE